MSVCPSLLLWCWWFVIMSSYFESNYIDNNYWLSIDPTVDALNDPEWPFSVKFYFRAGLSIASWKRGFRNLCSLPAYYYFKPKQTAAVSRGFPAIARRSCLYLRRYLALFLFVVTSSLRSARSVCVVVVQRLRCQNHHQYVAVSTHGRFTVTTLDKFLTHYAFCHRPLSMTLSDL